MKGQQRNRWQKINKDGLFNNLDSLKYFRENEKYDAPLNEQNYLEELEVKTAESLALIQAQSQACQDLTSFQTYVFEEDKTNISSFVALNKNQNEEAENEAKKQAENINKLGFDVTIHQFEDNGAKVFEVEAHMPAKYEDRDPLTLSEVELADAREEIKEEKSGNDTPSSEFKPYDMEKFHTPSKQR
jgi:hypothetical protein